MANRDRPVNETRSRLTLRRNGNLVLTDGIGSTVWLTNTFSGVGMEVHGLCGEYIICIYNPQPICTCPHGFSLRDHSNWSKGCSLSVILSHDSNKLDFMEIPNSDYFAYDLDTIAIGISYEECRDACLYDLRCKGFGYARDGSEVRYPKSFLLNGFHKPSTFISMYIKILKGLSTNEALKKLKPYELNCSAALVALDSGYPKVAKSNKIRYTKYLIGFVSSFPIIEAIYIGLTWWYVFRNQAKEEFVNMGYIELAMGFKRFTYAELKKATNNFKQEHKLLVYEYLENGSLDKILFSDAELGLEQKYKIALGIAKGLSYLHEECLEWVLHCDIKPQNILLDDQLEPKVADFRMSKLFTDIYGIKDMQGRRFSKAWGTKGYMALEWMMNLKIDAKADVYNYGIVLLELLSGKSASILISTLAKEYNEWNQPVQYVTEKIEIEGLKEVINPRLLCEYEKKKLERLMKVTLLCVQEDRNARPTMSKVMEVLLDNDHE
ncbi:hypothetical protein DVH24_004371 [Malus domestica]|uniref:Protein kinase domain-containing protein n=1 Tax=Malus domestica TaxID=3750 RepID=A0A498IET1_MALDO|nr:hypothetical protein DVH24_004371 [Malus domestica]